MPLYEVVVEGTINNQQTIWRSNWWAPFLPIGADRPAYRLLQGLGFDEDDDSAPSVGTILENFQQSNIGASVITSLFARNLYDPLDFAEIPLAAGWIGLQSGGAYAPSFVCASWRSSRTNLNVRRGHCSTWGIQEANIDDNNNVVGEDLTDQMDQFAELMSAPVMFVIGLQEYQFRSSIFSKERYMVSGSGTDPITNPARWAYKYYPDEETQLEHAALDIVWTRQTRVTSRNSRKVGRGA